MTDVDVFLARLDERATVDIRYGFSGDRNISGHIMTTENSTENSPKNIIAFQGEAGAYSDLACREAFPDFTTLPCARFELAFDAVRTGKALYGMIPIENSTAGRVTDIHQLLPEGGLHIIGEYFLPVHHQLMALPGVLLADVKTVHSHVQALGQCAQFLRQHGLTPVTEADTAGAAAKLAQSGDRTQAVLASRLAAEIYGLNILRPNVQDAAHNTTRFVILSRTPKQPAATPPRTSGVMTSFVFRVRNIPAALYKALGGFATNSINITKLESYMVGGAFSATQFYVDVEGHPEDRNLRLALEELSFFATAVHILGVYPAHPYRKIS